MSERQTRLTLIQKMQDGCNEAAWQEFVTIYRNYLYVVVRNMNVGHHDAEEIVQTVFTKVWDKIKGFQYLPEKGKFRHWLCSITRNTTIDCFRAKKDKRHQGDSEYADKNILAEEGITVSEVETMAEKEWVNYLANLALDLVKNEFSGSAVECFMAHVQGKSIQEISKEMNIAENTVYVSCSRVKERIRKKIREIEKKLG